jgi:PilZ domain
LRWKQQKFRRIPSVPLTFCARNRSTIRKTYALQRALALEPAPSRRHHRIMNDDNDDKERRDVTRTRVSRSAKIIPPRHGSMIHCTVQNITSSGACLKLANTYGMPETFELTFEHGRTRRACRVVWRTNDELGVAFEEAEAAVS